jgi:putative membrane protein
MHLAAQVAVAVVALLHVFFLVLEMFLWNTPYGQKRFGLTPEEAALTAPLAANQGLYNGFLAAGLVWGLWLSGPMAAAVTNFFLGCVLVAGLYGGITTRRVILYIQALPAAVAIALCLLAR